jgi:hypothetical protein
MVAQENEAFLGIIVTEWSLALRPTLRLFSRQGYDFDFIKSKLLCANGSSKSLQFPPVTWRNSGFRQSLGDYP